MSELHELINRLILTAAMLDGLSEIMAVDRQDMITVLRAAARAEAAEGALAAVDEYTTYYVLAWELFEEGGPEPLDFAEWLAAGKPEVQP